MQTATTVTRSNSAVPSSSRRPLAPRASLVTTTAREVTSDRALRETELLERLLVDDPTAWRRFTADYSNVVIGCIRRVLCRFTRVTSDHDVDEIYARFCFELLAHDKKKLRRFDVTKGTRLTTWLGLLATNATYDYLRRVRRERLSEPLPETDVFESSDKSPLDNVVLAEQAALAAEILAALSERDREFVELYFGEGLEPEEISERMGIHLKTVYTKKHKITARLESLVQRACAA